MTRWFGPCKDSGEGGRACQVDSFTHADSSNQREIKDQPSEVNLSTRVFAPVRLSDPHAH